MLYLEYSLLFCQKCYKDILKSLESSVEMPIMINSCNTFLHDEHDDVCDAIECIAKVVNEKWKFTNDSRRDIIKLLKHSYLKKEKVK